MFWHNLRNSHNLHNFSCENGCVFHQLAFVTHIDWLNLMEISTSRWLTHQRASCFSKKPVWAQVIPCSSLCKFVQRVLHFHHLKLNSLSIATCNFIGESVVTNLAIHLSEHLSSLRFAICLCFFYVSQRAIPLRVNRGTTWRFNSPIYNEWVWASLDVCFEKLVAYFLRVWWSRTVNCKPFVVRLVVNSKK